MKWKRMRKCKQCHKQFEVKHNLRLKCDECKKKKTVSVGNPRHLDLERDDDVLAQKKYNEPEDGDRCFNCGELVGECQCDLYNDEQYNDWE